AGTSAGFGVRAWIDILSPGARYDRGRPRRGNRDRLQSRIVANGFDADDFVAGLHANENVAGRSDHGLDHQRCVFAWSRRKDWITRTGQARELFDLRLRRLSRAGVL